MPHDATPQELEFLQAVGSMLRRPEYLLPLVAAERQYRDHYYRLIAGALLEDLFFDAFTNFVNQHMAASTLARALKGEKGWDYDFNGMHVGHKVFKGGAIAAIWDATLKDKTWTFDHPLHVIVGNHHAKAVTAEDGRGRLVRLKGASTISKRAKAATYALVVESASGSTLDVVRTWSVPEGSDRLWHHLDFADVWRTVARCVQGGAKWNEIDLMVAAVRDGNVEPGTLKVNRKEPRPAAYLLPQAWLKDIEVTSNNRALLVPAKTARGLLLRAQDNGLCAPIATWYQQYAEDRPPDLYSTQRLEYDALFGAGGFRR